MQIERQKVKKKCKPLLSWWVITDCLMSRNSVTFGTCNRKSPFSTPPEGAAFLNHPLYLHQRSFDCIYQMVHFFSGFMGLLFGQWNSLAKSSELLRTPIIRKIPGEWTDVFMRFFASSIRCWPHQTWAKLRKNNWFPVRFKPGGP